MSFLPTTIAFECQNELIDLDLIFLCFVEPSNSGRIDHLFSNKFIVKALIT